MSGSKSELRREMIARRDAMPESERGRIAAALTEALAAFAAIRRRPFGARHHGDRQRVEHARLPRPCARGRKDRGAAAAHAAARRLALHAVADLDRHLVPGIWSIPEPDPERCPAFDLDRVDFALVPALAVDRHGYRLGYGAGYFDKLLAGRGVAPFCVTALPAAFMLESLPHEAHDVPVDLALDERGAARACKRP
jgi:5-formyltetrahydrofolate cyclo-ligase